METDSEEDSFMSVLADEQTVKNDDKVNLDLPVTWIWRDHMLIKYRRPYRKVIYTKKFIYRKDPVSNSYIKLRRESYKSHVVKGGTPEYYDSYSDVSWNEDDDGFKSKRRDPFSLQSLCQMVMGAHNLTPAWPDHILKRLNLPAYSYSIA